MKEYRCKFCHKLLFKFNTIADVEKALIYRNDIRRYDVHIDGIEIKCSKCGKYNKITEQQLVAIPS